MSRAIFIRRRAENDVREAQQWYESKLIGLGDRFVLELNRALEELIIRADRTPLYYLNFRRVLLQRFPYKIFYQVEGDRVIVFRVLHASRDHRGTSF